MKNQFYFLTIITLLFMACNQNSESTKMKETTPSVAKSLDIEKTAFGMLKTGEAISLDPTLYDAYRISTVSSNYAVSKP